ncbi:hypothetical protein CHS0354_040418 [Potamilus streckersoni]|uniref:CCHC-type domain-containing protein n=1 Tax=Potamilus streckersoni TaxID=2493646 RepID=A0AAE0T0X3_9BIVA|nr:hypothetical protein CHS0354_040418 [Potamilus streckersoni]
MMVESRSEIKDGKDTSGSRETKRVETGKTERKAALALIRNKASVKADTYDGSQNFPGYMTHFEHCAMLNDWSENEKGMCLAACLRNDALQVFTDLQVQPGQIKFEKLKATLEARFAPFNQDEYYKKCRGRMGRFRRAGVKQNPISPDCTDYKESAYISEKSTVKTVIEQLEAKVEKLMEQNKKLTEEHQKGLDLRQQSEYKPRDARRSGVQCWNCNGWGHYQSECTKHLSRDNEQRKKIDRRKGDLQKIGNTGNLKPVRYLNEEPRLYTQCRINGIELALLADTDTAVSIISKSRYKAVGHRKSKLSSYEEPTNQCL